MDSSLHDMSRSQVNTVNVFQENTKTTVNLKAEDGESAFILVFQLSL